MSKNLIQTCSLCGNFDPLRRVCKISNETREAHDSQHASACKESGDFVRYLNVIPDSFNYFTIHEDTPADWSPDLTKVPKDKHGLPLIVKTRRGIERATPADPSIPLEVDTVIEGKVPAIYTYQGQREIIYEMGVHIAHQVAAECGVKLTVLPEEEGWEGLPEYVSAHIAAKSRTKGGTAWLTDKPVKWNH
jgi:hypothetical protein